MKKFLLLLLMISTIIPSTIFASEINDGNIMLVDDVVTATGVANDLIMLVGETVSNNADGEYAFIAGANVNIAGNISKDAFVIGEIVTIENDGIINRDLYVCGSKVIVSGTISGNLYVAAGELIVQDGASIDKDIKTTVGNIIISENAKVNGILEYNSDSFLDIPDKINTKIINIPTIEIQESSFKVQVLDALLGIGMSALILVCIYFCAPTFLNRIDNKYNFEFNRILKPIGKGLGLLFLIPIISLVLMITLVGIPLGVATLLIYIIAFIVSFAIAGYVLARIIFKDKIHSLLGGIIGISVLELVKMIPYVGWITYILSVTLTLGILSESVKREKAVVIEEKDIINDEMKNQEDVNNGENNI